MLTIAAGAWLVCKCKEGVKLRRNGTCADYESVNDCEQVIGRESFDCDAFHIKSRTWPLEDATSDLAVSPVAAATAMRTQPGRGVAKTISDWAGPKLAETADKQHKRAAVLRKCVQSNQEAIAKLRELAAQDLTPSSLTVKLPPAAQKLLPELPAAAELIKQTEKTLMTEALRQRTVAEGEAAAELASILSGNQFMVEARSAVRYDSLAPERRIMLEPLLISYQDEFLLTMELADLDMSVREDRSAGCQSQGRPRQSGQTDGPRSDAHSRDHSGSGHRGGGSTACEGDVQAPQASQPWLPQARAV